MADNDGGMRILDVKNPNQPVLVIGSDGNPAPKSVAIADHLVYAAGPRRFQVFDVIDAPGVPTGGDCSLESWNRKPVVEATGTGHGERARDFEESRQRDAGNGRHLQCGAVRERDLSYQWTFEAGFRAG